MKSRQTNLKKGFTLVEILFALGVISIVIGLGIINFSGATEQAIIIDMKGDLRAVVAEEEAARILGDTI
jgi:prepilin-type N-terminal cleavage/methylation domain-containing protein